MTTPTNSTAAVLVREATADEYDDIERLCVEAYVAAGTITADDPYVRFLRDTAHRANEPGVDVLVAVDPQDNGRIVGTATLCPYGSSLTEVCLPGEVEPRVLAVAPDQIGRGIAGALVDACYLWARSHNLHTVTVCVAEHNQRAHSLYRKLGFTRVPDRDWSPVEGVTLQTYTHDVAESHDQSGAVYCTRCGEELATGDHAACTAALDLEPPRYCSQCKRRMVVQVTPTGWRARCKEHGTISGTLAL